MLNLLISILGDSYDLFMLEKTVYDLKEKIGFSLEIQTTLFWNQKYNQSKYIYVLSKAFDDGENNNNDDWQGKIVYLEKRQEKKIDELNQNTNELKDAINGKDFKVKIAEIEQNMKENMKGVEGKISGLEQKLETKMNEVDKKLIGVEQKLNGVEEFMKEILNIMKNNK